MKEGIKMWFDGKNEPFNAKFIYNNMPVREILI
jgi:hypothetical protein